MIESSSFLPAILRVLRALRLTMPNTAGSRVNQLCRPMATRSGVLPVIFFNFPRMSVVSHYKPPGTAHLKLKGLRKVDRRKTVVEASMLSILQIARISGVGSVLCGATGSSRCARERSSGSREMEEVRKDSSTWAQVAAIICGT